jgi:hypothetical protein
VKFGPVRDEVYLQVRDEAGYLLGLMRGPFPAEWIRRGVISFAEHCPFCVEAEGPARIEYRRFDVPVQWWGEYGGACLEVWPCLMWLGSLEDLRKLKGFR